MCSKVYVNCKRGIFRVSFFIFVIPLLLGPFRLLIGYPFFFVITIVAAFYGLVVVIVGVVTLCGTKSLTNQRWLLIYRPIVARWTGKGLMLGRV